MHIEALTEKGKAILPLLANFSDMYLTGGTAIALQIGHRVSVDFDFFSDTKIPKNLLGKVELVFTEQDRVVSVNNADELTLFVDGVKLTFLHYPWPALLPTVQEEGLRLLSLQELGATKAYTIGRRGELKDYVDMYYLLQGGQCSLDGIARMAYEKYGDIFDKRLFLEQLLYFDDIEDTSIQFLMSPVNKETLKRFFEDEIRKIEI